MFTLSYWLPLLIFVAVWLGAWRFFTRMAKNSEKNRREMMKDWPHDKNGPDPTIDP